MDDGGRYPRRVHFLEPSRRAGRQRGPVDRPLVHQAPELLRDVNAHDGKLGENLAVEDAAVLPVSEVLDVRREERVQRSLRETRDLLQVLLAQSD